MANLLMGLSGLFGGAAQGFDAFKDRQMRQMLFNAQMMQAGGVPDGQTSDTPQTVLGQSGNVTQGGNGPMGSLSTPPLPTAASNVASLGSVAGNQTQSGAGAGPMAPGALAASGVGNQTQSGGGSGMGGPSASPSAPPVPTTQGGVLQALRAANDATPAPAPPATGNNFAVAAQGPAPMTAPSGTPTPGASPTGVDPIGGLSSGLADIAARYEPSIPHGIVHMGGFTFDRAQSPQAIEMRKSMLDVMARAQEQQNLFAQQGKLETTREGFETGQQKQLLASEETRSANQLAQNERDAARNVNLRMAELRSEREWRETMLGVGQNKTATAALDKSLTPYETQASTIKSALAELDLARTHPAATDAARISTAMAQVAAASPRLNEGLADLAGKGMDPSVAGTWQRFFGTATGGVSPAKQIDDAQAVLKGEMNAVHQNWSTAAMATLSSHPEISDGPTRLATREGVYFPASSAPNTGGSTMVIGPKTRAAAADPKDPNHAAAVRMIQQAAAQGSP